MNEALCRVCELCMQITRSTEAYDPQKAVLSIKSFPCVPKAVTVFRNFCCLSKLGTFLQFLIISVLEMLVTCELHPSKKTEQSFILHSGFCTQWGDTWFALLKEMYSLCKCKVSVTSLLQGMIM